MSAKLNRVFAASSVAMWCLTVTPVSAQALMSLVAYGAQDVYLNAIALDDTRRNALIAFVQAYEPMHPDLRQVTLTELRRPEVPIALVQRFEALMAQQ